MGTMAEIINCAGASGRTQFPIPRPFPPERHQVFGTPFLAPCFLRFSPWRKVHYAAFSVRSCNRSNTSARYRLRSNSGGSGSGRCRTSVNLISA